MNPASRCLFVALFACLPLVTQATAPVTLRVVTPFASGHLLAETANRFRNELARSAPHIQVSVQAGVLNEQSIDPAFAKCEAGERVGEVLLTGGQPIQDYAPAYFFFNGPYVIRDFAHLKSIWQGPSGRAMGALIETRGNMVAFDPLYRGYRQFTANSPISVPANFAGLKLRLPPVPDWITVWQSLGVAPVQVPLPGIHAALASGEAEASEGDLSQISSLKLPEVQKYLILTRHLVGFGMPLANACFFHKELGESDREAVRQAMDKATAWASRFSEEQEVNQLAALQKAGMTVIQPDANAIRRTAEPAIRKLFETTWTVVRAEEVLTP